MRPDEAIPYPAFIKYMKEVSINPDIPRVYQEITCTYICPVISELLTIESSVMK